DPALWHSSPPVLADQTGGLLPWPGLGHRCHPAVAAVTPLRGQRSTWWLSGGRKTGGVPVASGATAGLSPLRRAVPALRRTHCPPAARLRRWRHADVPSVTGLALIADRVPCLLPSCPQRAKTGAAHGS